jgi:TolA-binding protein
MNSATDDRDIQRYLDGDMPEAERAEFETTLASKPELQQQLEEYRQLQEAVFYQKRRTLWDKVQQLEAQHNEKKIVSIDRPSNKTNWLPYAIAASVALLAIAWVSWWNQRALTPQELVAQNLTFLDSLSNEFNPQTRGEESSLEQEAFAAYVDKDYEQAIFYFEQYLTDSSDALATLFLGVSYLKEENYKSAVTALEKYLNNYPSNEILYVEKANWSLVLAYIGNEQTEVAETFIINHKNELGKYYSKATNIVETVKKQTQ